MHRILVLLPLIVMGCGETPSQPVLFPSTPFASVDSVGPDSGSYPCEWNCKEMPETWNRPRTVKCATSCFSGPCCGWSYEYTERNLTGTCTYSWTLRYEGAQVWHEVGSCTSN